MGSIGRRRSLAALAVATGMAVALAASASAMPGQLDSKGIASFIRSEMAATGATAMSVAVVRDDSVVFAEGFGVADESGREVSARTPFILGSISKSFTALAVMQLVEAGRVDLDAPVQRYLPWFGVGGSAASAQITVRHVLNQTSGIDTQTGNDVEQFGTGADAIERNVRALAGARLACSPGSCFQYSNVNYEIAGLIVQTVAGEPFGDYVEKHIFGPLRMEHSHTSLASARADGLPLGYRTSFWGAVTPADDWPYLPGELPSGYLVSSAEDMGHWLLAHLNGGSFEGESVLSAGGIATLHDIPDSSSDASYAMGWGSDVIAGHAALEHPGSTASSTASMVIVPSRRLGVVVLMNLNSGDANLRMARASEGLASILLGGSWDPPGQDSFLRTVRVFVLAALAWEVLSVAALWAFRRSRRRVAAVALLAFAVIDGAIVYGCLVEVPAMAQAGIPLMSHYTPDVAAAVVGLSIVAVALAAMRLAVLAVAVAGDERRAIKGLLRLRDSRIR